MAETSGIALSAGYIQQRISLSSTEAGSSLQESLSGGVVEAGSNGTAFGASFVIDISLQDTTPSGTIGDLLKAVTTLQQSQAEFKTSQKAEASKRLQLLVKELALLKLLGTGLAAAREAVSLAKQITAAVQQYAGAGGTDDSVLSALSSADAAKSATPTSTDASTASGTTAQDPTGQDPFYALADAALAELRKYLKRLLPNLQASPDKKTRKEALSLSAEFDAATAASAAAEQSADGAATSATAVPASVDVLT